MSRLQKGIMRPLNLWDPVGTSLGAKVSTEHRTEPRPEPRQAVMGLGVAWREQLEKAVTQLYLLPESPKPQVLVFLTPEPGRARRSVCAHCGDLLAARVPVPVCLLEANPAVVSMRQALGISGGKSLADLLGSPDPEMNADVTREDGSVCTVEVPGRNLWLVAGGLPLRDKTPLAQSGRLADRMNEFRMRFDFVLVDAPPLNNSSDGLTLARLADGAVLVLPATGASRKSTRNLKKDIEASGVTLLGAILIDQDD